LPKIKAGVLEGKFINVDQVVDLANLPPKDVLLSMVLRTMQAPITSFVRANNSIITKLLYALNAIKEEKENN
jgi:large subunit ribosomal protein L10